MGMNVNFFNSGNSYQDDQNLRSLQMDIAYTNMQFFSLKKANSKQVFLTALQSSDYRTKAAACLMAYEYGFDYIDDLIDAVGSSDIVLNQSARQSLVRLSNKVLCGEEQIKKQKEAAKQKEVTSNKNANSKVANKSSVYTPANVTHYVDFGPNIYFLQNNSLNASQNMWKVWFNEKIVKENQKKSKN